MLFNSLEYVVLLAAVVPLYWLVPHVLARQGLLLLASLLFYASWSPPFLVLLLGTVLVNWVVAGLLERRRLPLIALIVSLDLGALGYFKYSDFIVENVNWAAAALGADLSWPMVNAILPLGISFYTFQLIAYVVDVRRGELEHERNPLTFALFATFFPQLIAGPICRGSELLPQLRALHRFQGAVFINGLLLLASGFFLKVGIADGIAPFVERVFADAPGASGADVRLATVGFGVQILCDFWGYSTMAVGAGLLFGIRLPHNFDLPYIALSIREFWRRWHQTLSYFLRDYLYIPLGGRHESKLRTARNLLIVMALGGLWHGASYNFVVWGLIHGLWLVIERYVPGLAAKLPRERRAFSWRVLPGTLLRWSVTMAVVFLAWIWFRAEGAEAALSLTRSFVSGAFGELGQGAGAALVLLLLFLVVHVPLHRLHSAETADLPRPALCLAIGFWLLLFGLILGAGETHEFIYFQF